MQALPAKGLIGAEGLPQLEAGRSSLPASSCVTVRQLRARGAPGLLRPCCHDVPVTTAAGETFETGAFDRLRTLTGDPSAEFRPDQLEAIRDVVLDRSRVLCVQRTGWGKSAVYFV